ncbi:allergen [Amylostereum chailletii]|nr:allergen [Amylostereum chailletii]
MAVCEGGMFHWITYRKNLANAVEVAGFDFSIDGAPAGRVVFRLFDKVTPITARNFRELATGQHGFGYAGSEIHRIIPGFMIQGGDITTRDGTGGRSIYGGKFYDENFYYEHSRPGLLSMGNRGPSSNLSQFFITTAPGPHCDGQNVVFGEVVSGLDVVRHIQEYASDDILRRPMVRIVIERCGVV